MTNDLPDQTEGGAPRAPRWLALPVRVFAGIGGAVLLAMMLMTVASVVLRGTLGRPIAGDFELVELASAIVIFCFLPICQMEGGNVVVDFFTTSASARVQHLLEALGDLLYLALAALLLWRSWHGAVEMRMYDEQTMVLRLPVWWSFAIILPAMALLVATCTATLAHHLRAAVRGERA
ncbi:TRAP transporter small permease [Frigidibacter sp. MR17.24]|uniref:TRAP transporter small permease n=1 Tax=Frigidibacter sp. MR17.24 TaxID=3127345 RepID=UPI003012CCD2